MQQQMSKGCTDCRASQAARPRVPVVRSACCAHSRRKLLNAYAMAYAYAKAGTAVLSKIANMRVETSRSKAWRHPVRSSELAVPQRWFGGYSKLSLAHLLRAYTAVIERFERGYKIGNAHQAPVLLCLDGRHAKCRSSVLANASVFGTIRICPALLIRPQAFVGLVVLHEMLHQKLKIHDQRDPICRRQGDDRCYGPGALKLVRHGRWRKAIRNNDNLAYFAQASYRALQADLREASL